MSNQLRKIHVPGLQHFSGLVPSTPQTTAKDPADVCVFEDDPVGDVHFDLLVGESEKNCCPTGPENLESFLE